MRVMDFFFLKEGGERSRTIFSPRESNGRQKGSGEKLRKVEKSWQEGEKEQKGDCISPKEKRSRARPIGITQFQGQDHLDCLVG